MSREELIKEFGRTYSGDIEDIVEEVDKVIDKLYDKFKEFVEEEEEESTKIEVDTDFWKMIDEFVIGQL